jgi:FkbM family methyltransferase
MSTGLIRNVSILKKFIKPWYLHSPLTVVRALLFDIGFVRRGWMWVSTCFGVSIFCDTSKAIGRSIYKNGVYELPTSELVWRLLNDRSIALFVDVGANVGWYSVLARKKLGPNGRVIAFEPMPDVYKKLKINLNSKHVDFYQWAVSLRSGFSTLSLPKGSESNDGMSTLQDCDESVAQFRVKTVTLDEFLDVEVYILKLDIEGHEFSALSGASRLLKEGKIQNIIFEDHDIEGSGTISLLLPFGYKIFSIGWSLEGLILKPLGEENSSYIPDAPNYIATLDDRLLEKLSEVSGWTILSGD